MGEVGKSPAALQRLHAGARDLVLPPDLRVTPGQLRRLFLLEDVAVAAAAGGAAGLLSRAGRGFFVAGGARRADGAASSAKTTTLSRWRRSTTEVIAQPEDVSAAIDSLN